MLVPCACSVNRFRYRQSFQALRSLAVRYHSVASQLCIFLILYIYVQLQYLHYIPSIMYICTMKCRNTIQFPEALPCHKLFYKSRVPAGVRYTSHMLFVLIYLNIDICLQCKRIIQSHCCLCSLGHRLKFTYGRV
jgi:hypothetical protein